MESRLEQELKAWKEREQRLSGLLTSSGFNGSELLKRRLAHYEMLQAKFLSTQHPGDREALKDLRIERRQIERKLYPNLLVRLARRIIVYLDIKQRASKIDKQDLARQEQIKAELVKAGLGGYSQQVIARMKFEGNEFTLPVAWNMPGRNRMDLQVQFKRDQQGHFQYQGYQATVIPETGKRQSFQVDAGQGMQASQAYNMLSGRAVHVNATWCQLDMNDRDASGNCKIRHFPPDFRFDLHEAVNKLPFKDLEDVDRIIHALENGDRVSAGLILQGKKQDAFLEADPRWGRVTILNSDLERIDDGKEKAGNVVAMRFKKDLPDEQVKKRSRPVKL